MQEIFYRQLISQDHDEYKRVRLACLQQFPDNFGSGYEEEKNAATLKLSHAVNEPDKNNFVFGAFTAAGKLIGMCGFIGEKRQKTKHRGEVIQMFVYPDFSGKGIGKKLLQLSTGKAFENEEIEQITLSVVNSNEKAKSMYMGLGFVEYGKLDHYFKAGNKYFTQSFLVLVRDHQK